MHLRDSSVQGGKHFLSLEKQTESFKFMQHQLVNISVSEYVKIRNAWAFLVKFHTPSVEDLLQWGGSF